MAAKAALQVGDRVTVGQTELMGTVKFAGTTEFATGDWLGIELDEQAGKNDGSVKGKRYFDSKPEHGIFVRPAAATNVAAGTLQAPLVVISEGPKEDVSTEQPKKLEAPSNRSSRSSGTLAPPGEKPKRLSERSFDVHKAGVQLELAQAMEDHDVETIRRVLPVASNLQIDPKEIAAAKRILSFEVQQNLVEEIDTVRSMVSQLAEAVAKVEERASAKTDASQGMLQRIGPELERRVWAKLQPTIERLLRGFVETHVSQVPEAKSKTGLEDYGFEDFDLNGDGYITREEFDQVRSKILKGEPLPPKAAPPLVVPEVVVIPPPAEPKQAEPTPVTAEQPLSPVEERKIRTPEEEALSRALRRSVYTRAASMQKALSLGSEHYESVRWFVKHLFKRAAVRSAEMLAQSVEEKRAEAYADIASIRASKKRIEDAERKAEQQLEASTIKLQACARGKIARQQRQQMANSTLVLQRSFRRLRQRWQQGRKMDFSAVVRAVQGQRKDWTMEYHLACGSQDALNREAFVTALQKVHVKISTSKVEKLWQGFVLQSDEENMRLPTFWAICEAVGQGDALAAEFADLSLEEYLEGEDDGQNYSVEEALAAQRIQAAQRGRQARRARQQRQARLASERAAAERIQAALLGRMVREQEAAAERIQACHRGRMVRECQASSQMAALPPQEVPNDLATQEAAAEKIQAMYRGRMVREKQASRSAEKQDAAVRPTSSAAEVFQEALVQQGSGLSLQLPAFSNAISKAAPSTSESQARVLFDGTCEGTGQDGITLKLFCDILQAVQLGDDAASQFADLHVEDYRALRG